MGAAWGAAGLGGVIGAWFLLGRFVPGMVPDAVNANVAGAGMAGLLPLGAAAVIGSPTRAEPRLGVLRWVAAALLAVGGVALAAAGSVGAWIALGLGGRYGRWWALRPALARARPGMASNTDGALVRPAGGGAGARRG